MAANEKVPLNSRKIAAMKLEKTILADVAGNRRLREVMRARRLSFFWEGD